jgi:predicted RecA/RadA family phage recombinase
MRNYVHSNERLTITAPYTCLPGSMVGVGAIVGVALDGAASAAPVTIVTAGVFELTHAVTNTAAAVGDVAYYDTTNRVISATTTFPRAGVYVAPKVTTSTAVTVRLNGTF